MSKIRTTLRYFYRKVYHKLHYETQKGLINQGKLLALANASREISELEDAEFQVFSQRGEDGILQYIIGQVPIPNRIFVEFGVEDYTESNTRFLLMNNNWSGLVIDGDKDNIRFIQSDFIYWKYDISAVLSFITRDNINALISAYTSCSDIGLLSVDVDGNDYWIWEAITVIQPRIVVCEYNSAFGPAARLSIPYKADFYRTAVHSSNLYFGASLGAFCYLAERKGYDFIGVGGAGVNAFFVRKDLCGPFRKRRAEEAFRESANRDSQNNRGKNTFLRHPERLPVIRELPLMDVVSGETRAIKEWYNL